IRNFCDKLYPHHRPTKIVAKCVLAVGSSVTALLKPIRGDMVAAFGDVTGYYALKNIQFKMLSDKTGRQILREKPRIDSKILNLETLQKLPHNTLGY
ncbi:hypothetical protein HZS_627, partial [Henneguya salminicola]